jgi:hypothetical protein
MDSDDESQKAASNATLKRADAESDSAPERKRRTRLSEAQKLAAAGNMSKAERFRSSSPVAAQIKVAETSAAAAELLPRPRPEPGARAEPPCGGVYKAHIRQNSQGLLNWRNYGALPPARTVVLKGEEVKVFEWIGLFTKDKDGRRVFVEKLDGPNRIEMSEYVLDFWDTLKRRWIEKRYGKPVAASERRESFLKARGLASLDYNGAATEYALSADSMRTWHTREFLC